MEMTPVWEERKRKSPFPLFPHGLGKLANSASFPHSHSFGDDWRFPFFSNSFNFNFDEKCYLHARYLLLPTCPTTHNQKTTGFIAPEVRFSAPTTTFSAASSVRGSGFSNPLKRFSRN
jgi:hypothetical protein